MSFVRELKAKVHPKLLRKYRSELTNDKTLSFGRISINQQQITIRKKGCFGKNAAFPWRQVSQIEPRDGFLVVEFNHRRGLKIPVGQVPNVEILIQLIQEGLPG